MDRIVLHGPNDLRIEAQSEPRGQLGSGEIDVQTLMTGLSNGTEISAYTGRYGPAFYGWPFPYPCSMGYQNLGRVVAVGSDVTDVSCGDLIYSLKSHCEYHRLASNDIYWKPPGNERLEVTTFTYLIGLGLQALRRSGLVLGERIAVVGLGPIGLATVMLARQFGSTVLGVDLARARRGMADRLGASMTLDPTSPQFSSVAREFAGDAGIDIVVETAGTWPALQVAADLVRCEGRITIVALHPNGALFNPVGELFYKKLYSLISSSYPPVTDYPSERVRFTLRRTCDEILRYISAGDLPYHFAISHSVHYTDVPSIYRQLASGDLSITGVVIHWA
jgi:threonine dehydrogenase-like Zn-dependent dehydrogenase